VTFDVVREAQAAGLDLLTLPSYTFHAMQPLDVSIFKPFKTFFREYRDFWTSRNLNQVVTKQTLEHWVSLGLKRALTPQNIKNGFRSTGIFPLNENAVDSHFGPNGTFEHASRRGSSAAANLQTASLQLPEQAGQANLATTEELEEQAEDVPAMVGADIEADL
jgi:hypothetical protein